jgi:hypothetical protein
MNTSFMYDTLRSFLKSVMISCPIFGLNLRQKTNYWPCCFCLMFQHWLVFHRLPDWVKVRVPYSRQFVLFRLD